MASMRKVTMMNRRSESSFSPLRPAHGAVSWRCGRASAAKGHEEGRPRLSHDGAFVPHLEAIRRGRLLGAETGPAKK